MIHRENSETVQKHCHCHLSKRVEKSNMLLGWPHLLFLIVALASFALSW